MPLLSQLGGFVKVRVPWKVHCQVTGHLPYWKFNLDLHELCPLYVPPQSRDTVRFYRVSNVGVRVSVERELDFELTILNPTRNGQGQDVASQVTHNVAFATNMAYPFTSMGAPTLTNSVWYSYDRYGTLISDNVPYLSIVTVSGFLDMWWSPVDYPVIRTVEGEFVRRQVAGPRIGLSYLPSVAYSSHFRDLERLRVGHLTHPALSEAFDRIVATTLPPHSEIVFLDRRVSYTPDSYDPNPNSDSESDEDIVYHYDTASADIWEVPDRMVEGGLIASDFADDDEVPIPVPLRPRVYVYGDDQVTASEHWYDVQGTHPPAA